MQVGTKVQWGAMIPHASYASRFSGYCQYPAHKFNDAKFSLSLKSARFASIIEMGHCSALVAVLRGRKFIVMRNRDLVSLETRCGTAFHDAWREGLMNPISATKQ